MDFGKVDPNNPVLIAAAGLEDQRAVGGVEPLLQTSSETKLSTIQRKRTYQSSQQLSSISALNILSRNRIQNSWVWGARRCGLGDFNEAANFGRGPGLPCYEAGGGEVVHCALRGGDVGSFGGYCRILVRGCGFGRLEKGGRRLDL